MAYTSLWTNLGVGINRVENDQLVQIWSLFPRDETPQNTYTPNTTIQDVDHTHGYFNQNTQGYFNQNTQGYLNQNTPGYFNQNTPGYFNQNTPGYLNQNTPGYFNQNTPGYLNQNAPGYFNQNTPGYLNQNTQVYFDQNTPPPGYKCHLCQSSDHFIRNCVKAESKEKSFTPYQGKKKSCGGYMCSKCKRKWFSYNSYANITQTCIKCKIRVYAYKQFNIRDIEIICDKIGCNINCEILEIKPEEKAVFEFMKSFLKYDDIYYLVMKSQISHMRNNNNNYRYNTFN